MIYFAESRGLIKIGYSNTPTDRVVKLKATLLKVIHGTREDEKVLHARFAAHRVRGEWFHAAPLLMEFIRKQRSARETHVVMYIGISSKTYDQIAKVAKEGRRPICVQALMIIEDGLDKYDAAQGVNQ